MNYNVQNLYSFNINIVQVDIFSLPEVDESYHRVAVNALQILAMLVRV